MPRRFIKRYMPHPDRIKHNKSLRFLGTLIHDPNLWHLNRHSVARAMAVGLFWAMIPMPLQMLAAAACAIPARANLPIAVGLVWLTNPLTMPPVFYCNYKVGTWLMGSPAFDMPAELSLAWIRWLLQTHWQPLYLGSLVLGIVLAVLGYSLTQLYWRIWVRRSWRKRQQTRSERRNSDHS
ncbi:DUF2062 domain-containing protein [Stutzerimonas azotifigens]|uniref:DUF2062 domain-containing protein n=1 Tax=Stutzerimonas azotifigens TaxID=291995 RepID=UPI00040C5395|nr:DUF2062 domain-containing protein [Stutzerimonas azotifigens]